MSRSLLPWLLPVGMVVVVVAIATSTILAVVLALVVGMVGVPIVYRAYQANRPGQAGGIGKGRARRPDPPNNKSLLR